MGEKDDEDVMLTLKNLSVQGSDEEDEPGMMFSSDDSHQRSYVLPTKHLFALLAFVSTGITPSKGNKKTVCLLGTVCVVSYGVSVCVCGSLCSV